MSDDKTRILSPDEAARLAAAAEGTDDRTRVLSEDEAARILARPKAVAMPAAAPDPADREPKLVGDKIVFFCANGHRIVVDRGLAGKKGNCSKPGCGAAVVIPIPPGLEPPQAPRPEPERGVDAAETVAPDPFAAAIPIDLGVAVTESTASLQPPAEPGAAVPEWDFMAGAGPAADATPDGLGLASDTAATGWALDFGEIDNPTARLVARLWLERAHGGIVEVHLAGGGVIMPEFYDPQWSSGAHALFAALAADGTVTLTAVAWDQVQKVVVRQVQGKPDGMFEG